MHEDARFNLCTAVVHVTLPNSDENDGENHIIGSAINMMIDQDLQRLKRKLRRTYPQRDFDIVITL